jgi:hypothetical protein
MPGMHASHLPSTRCAVDAAAQVLEPRRVAAKSAARRMAALLGEPVGCTVGYRVKLDTRVRGRGLSSQPSSFPVMV